MTRRKPKHLPMPLAEITLVDISEDPVALQRQARAVELLIRLGRDCHKAAPPPK